LRGERFGDTALVEGFRCREDDRADRCT
jgi:hypothetical protein